MKLVFKFKEIWYKYKFKFKISNFLLNFVVYKSL